MPSSRDNAFRYSVEQIWLLQRLRACGLSRDQILAGLDDLDRLDGTQHTQASFTGFQTCKLEVSSEQTVVSSSVSYFFNANAVDQIKFYLEQALDAFPA